MVAGRGRELSETAKRRASKEVMRTGKEVAGGEGASRGGELCEEEAKPREEAKRRLVKRKKKCSLGPCPSTLARWFVKRKKKCSLGSCPSTLARWLGVIASLE